MFGISVRNRLPGGPSAREIWLKSKDQPSRPGHADRERNRMADAALRRCGLSPERAGSLIALLRGHGPAALDWLAEAEQTHEHDRREGLAKEAARQHAAEAGLIDDDAEPIDLTDVGVVIEDETYEPTG